MSHSRASRLGWYSLALAVALAVAGNVLVAVEPSRLPEADRWDFLSGLYSIAYLVFSLVGALIIARAPENRVGWILSAFGLANALWLFVLGYTIRSVAGDADWLPAGAAFAWIDNIAGVVGVWLLAPIFFLFPTGRPLSPRWRLPIWVAAAGMSLGVVAAAVRPGPVDQIEAGVDNPLGVASLEGVTTAVDGFLGIVLAALAAAGVACLVARFRQASAVERLQLKWFAYASGLALSLLVVLASQAILHFGEGHLADRVVSVLLFAAIVALPAAVGIAILRHGLYEIDVVINRTIVYGALTATLALAYLGLVLVLQLALSPLTADSSLAIAGSTLAVAALFRPARARIQALVDRRFYRRKYDAARTVEAFSARLRDQVELESLSSELRHVIADTMQPAHLSLWLRVPKGMG